MHARADRTLGVVLAGGAGSRVGGADKGLLALFGRPLVERLLEILRPQCDALLIVANRNLDEYAEYAPVIHDEVPAHAGPLAGLVAVFRFLAANRHAQWSWLATVPVDCPEPPRDLTARLRMPLDAQPASGCAFARCSGMAQPLFALYRIGDDIEGWHRSAQSALDAHGSAKHWHAGLHALAVDFDADCAAFHNLNSPEDFVEYERTHGGT